MCLNTIPEQALTKWRGVAERNCLPMDEVHVWWVDLRVEGAALCDYWDLLSPDEMRRASAYRFAKDRREFVVTRALLRQILGHYADRAPAGLCLGGNSGGKPVLRGTTSLHFSVSHSRDVALLAIAHKRVGIDVEYVQSGVLRQTVIEQFLSPPEQSDLQALPAKKRARALYRCWTQKEAVLKAHGMGLLYPPRHVSVLANGRKSHVVKALGRRWLVREIAAPAGYVAAAAMEKPSRGFKWRQWEFLLKRVHV